MALAAGASRKENAHVDDRNFHNRGAAMRRRLPLGAARAPLAMPKYLPLPDGVELEADAAPARWVEEDRRAEAEELSELDLLARCRLSDWQVE
jgi:hypothetical protein